MRRAAPQRLIFHWEGSKSSPDISKKSSTTLKTKVAAQTQELLVIKPVEAKPLVEVKQTVKEIAKETPKASGKIEQFVVDYVSQLSTNSSLLEVVNDRDTVRDLLAQGTNTLKVDPSDILNTLLQWQKARQHDHSSPCQSASVYKH